jgi:EmrB/QacA subfamily drug resistance transporter
VLSVFSVVKNMTENNTQRTPDQKAVLLSICISQFLTPFMVSSVGIALPTIGNEFSASAVHLGLIEMLFVLGSSLFLLPAGRVGDIYGRKRMYIIGFGIFSLTTLMAAGAWSINSFIIIRFLQGGSSAFVLSSGLAILTSIFPSDKRGQVLGISVACVYCGLSFGPTVGGLMISHIGWRWIFATTVPFQIVAILLAMKRIKGEWRDAKGERFDLTGTAIYIFALSFLIFGASKLETNPFAQYFMIAGGAGILIFLYAEYHIKSPLLDVGLLISNRVFTFSNIATLINYAASFGVSFFFSLYLQIVKGVSPQHAGLILICQPVVQAILSPIAGRIADKKSPSFIATIGMIITAIGLGLAAMVDKDTGLPLIIIMLVLLGNGFAFFASPNMTTVMSSVEPKHYGIASSLVSTMRTVGMLFCMTIITYILSWKMGDHAVSVETQDMFLYCMHFSFLIFSGMSVVGIIFSMARR